MVRKESLSGSSSCRDGERPRPRNETPSFCGGPAAFCEAESRLAVHCHRIAHSRPFVVQFCLIEAGECRPALPFAPWRPCVFALKRVVANRNGSACGPVV